MVAGITSGGTGGGRTHNLMIRSHMAARITVSQAARLMAMSEQIFRRKHLPTLSQKRLWEGGPILLDANEVEEMWQEKAVISEPDAS